LPSPISAECPWSTSHSQLLQSRNPFACLLSSLPQGITHHTLQWWWSYGYIISTQNSSVTLE
jgi:hypothetical protein